MCADNISTFPLCVSLSLLILNADLLSLLVRFYSLTKRCLLLLPMLTEGKEPMQLWRWKCGKGEGEASTCSFVVVMDRRMDRSASQHLVVRVLVSSALEAHSFVFR